MRVERPESNAQRRTRCRAGGVSPLVRPGHRAQTLFADNSRLTPAARLPASDSSGFTLVELLVVITILALLTVMTVAAVNFGFAAERIRSAARQVQSYLEGARDRAIYERHPVGVRFLNDPNVLDEFNNPITSTSMVFIEKVDPAPTGRVTLTAPPEPGDAWVATRTSGEPTWTSLITKALLTAGDRIKIPADDDGFWYTIQDTANVTNPDNERVTFQPDFIPGMQGNYSFQLDVAPVVRPNQEPMLLPRGIAIDIARSQPRRFWSRGRLDVMFSPRGTVTGRQASGGLIHFYLAETADVERLQTAIFKDRFPTNPDFPAFESEFIPSDGPISNGPNAEPEPLRDRLIVTLFPQTGAISSHPVNVTDQFNNYTGAVGADRKADDPFYFAETGEVAGE